MNLFESQPRTFLNAAALVAAVALMLAGCLSAPKSVPPQTKDVWPLPPEDPRIETAGMIRGPTDVGIRPSGFARFGNWLAGSSAGDEQLIKPFGVALDENDNLCLTDTGANAVFYFDRQKKKWRRWDSIGKIRFISPVAIAKRNGVFFVADSGLGRVVAFNENGKLLFQISEKLERPTGLAIVGERLFVTDSQAHKVEVFDLNGRYVSAFGGRGSGAGQFNFPTHIAADSDGNLLVTDSMNYRVQVLDATGKFKAQIGSVGDSSGQFSRPKGVAADSFGHVYVIDALFENMQIFDHQGRFLLTAGEAGSGQGQFWLPNGIAISRQNEIYITDSYNRRVQVFKYVGEL